MARPRKFDPETTKQEIMDAFWARGLEATSLADLMAATGLKKGSLYASFGDKLGMFQLALVDYDKKIVAATVAGMDALSGRDALVMLLTAPAIAVEDDDRRGCLLCNSLGEYGKLDQAAQALADRSRSDLTLAIERALVRLHGAGAYKMQALELLALYFGMRVLARGGVSADEIRAAGEVALAKL